MSKNKPKRSIFDDIPSMIAAAVTVCGAMLLIAIGIAYYYMS